MSATTEHPKVFLSYSWSGTEHEQFVLDLGNALRSHGVDAILDKWDLKPGQDKHVFMESMVVDPTVVRVLVLCDRKYQEKADARKGGVGTESQIISQELYTQVKQTKFIPIVCERDSDGNAFLPVFMKGLVYVDMSSKAQFGEGLDTILRLIYEQPFYQKPGLGAAPSFLKPDGGLPYAKELTAVIRAIHDGKPNRQGIEQLFVHSVITEVSRLYVQPLGNDGDEEIYQAILKTKGLRDQVAEYAETVASFGVDDPRELKGIISLLEGMGQQFGPPQKDGEYRDSWADLYKFFALEVLLLSVAAMLRHERWKSLRHLLKYPFAVRTDHSGLHTSSVLVFDDYIRSLDEFRNARLKLNRTCISADLIRERCSPTHTSFLELGQADIFVALYGAAHIKDLKGEEHYNYWIPRTTVYNGDLRKLPIFMKAVDPDIRNGIREALGVLSAMDMTQRMKDAEGLLDHFRALAVGPFQRFNFAESTNLQVLMG